MGGKFFHKLEVFLPWMLLNSFLKENRYYPHAGWENFRAKIFPKLLLGQCIVLCCWLPCRCRSPCASDFLVTVEFFTVFTSSFFSLSGYLWKFSCCLQGCCFCYLLAVHHLGATDHLVLLFITLMLRITLCLLSILLLLITC
jgi:hypothetical protein